ncbi:MAG: alpha/beta hydrolase [Thermoleophilia bacterium]
MQLDPQAQEVMDALQSLGPKPIEELSPEEARMQPTPADAVEKVLEQRGESTDPEPVAQVEDRTVPGPAGEIPVRVYTPMGEGTFPVLLYIHGGGWVIADLDVYDSSPRALANAVEAVVVSVDYRQAPENPFPAPVEDCYAVYRWVLEKAESIGGDPSRIALVGESAGGNLATVVAMLARDDGVQAPAHQTLIYPITDHSFDTDSYRQNSEAKPLNTPMMKWFFSHYLADEADGADPRVSPLRGDLEGLPPATIITAEVDPLRDDGRRYAERLQQAGVDVEYRHYEGVTHEFFGMGAVIDKAKDAVETAAKRLRESFDRAGETVQS